MSKPVRLALCQTAPRLGDVKRNLAQVLHWAERARASGAGLAVFPELALSGYFLKDLVADCALKEGSPALRSLEKASKGLDLLVGGVFEDDRHRFFNALFFLSRGRLAGIYRKIYLPTYGMFDEGRYFAAGSEVPVFRGPAGAFGCLLCEDAWHAVLPLTAALSGATLLVVSSSSPARSPLVAARGAREDMRERLDITRTWQRVTRTWAQTLGLAVAYCNRVGFEEGVGFWGGSELVSPQGEALAQAPLMTEHLLVAEWKPALARRSRVATPLLRDEKVDLDARLLAGLAGWKVGGQK